METPEISRKNVFALRDMAGHSHWSHVGTVLVAPDGSWNVTFFQMPTTRRFKIRDAASNSSQAA